MQNEERKKLIRSVILAGLLAGTMDITAAIIQTTAGGGDIIRLFHYIASGVLGKVAFDGGYVVAMMGLILHYVIAMSWTILYFLIYPKISFLRRNWMLSAILYGAFVWLMMNRVVIPLSNVSPFPFKLARAALAMAILMVCIGGPVAYLAKRHFELRMKSEE